MPLGGFLATLSANYRLLSCDDFRMAAVSLLVGGIDGGGNRGKVSGMAKMLGPE